MKRHMEADIGDGIEETKRLEELEELGESTNGIEPPVKKRRLVTLNRDSLCVWGDDDEDPYAPLEPEEEEKVEKIDQLLKRWGLPNNYGAKYVLETIANADEVDQL